MKIPRRDLLKFAGGTALGALFTPVPWKLVDDVAIWSQNWSWIPRPPTGAIGVRFTTCTLCPAGCGVRARTAGAQPVSLAGVRGGLCPAGLAGHHLACRENRMPGPLFRGQPTPLERAVEAVRAAVAAGGPVAVLDQRPGRTASLVYRKFVAGLPRGFYLTSPAREDATLRALERVTGAGPLAFDLEAARTVVSFGAPLLDGWGTPMRVHEARRNFRLVQVETRQSRTAAAADVWLPVKPGTEAEVARALAGATTLERAATLSGVPVEQLREAARLIAANGPAVAIGCGDPAGPLSPEEENAVAALNGALGAVGRTIVARPPVPAPAGFEKQAPESAWDEVPDRSVRVLLIDESMAGTPAPWAWVNRKLAPGALVAAMASSLDGYARHVEYVIPSPVYLEAAQDATAPCDSRSAGYSLSPALVAAAPGAVEPADFVARVAGGGTPLADVMKARVEAIAKARRGTVFTCADGKTVPVAEVADLWKAFQEGAQWTDARAPAPAAQRYVPAKAAVAPRPAAEGYPLALVPFGWRGATGAASPLYSKLYQESGVRDAAGEARMNPATAAEHGVGDGARVAVETRCGTATMRAALDDGVMPGVIETAVAPGTGILEICNVEDRCGWRCAPARMRKA